MSIENIANALLRLQEALREHDLDLDNIRLKDTSSGARLRRVLTTDRMAALFTSDLPPRMDPAAALTESFEIAGIRVCWPLWRRG